MKRSATRQLILLLPVIVLPAACGGGSQTGGSQWVGKTYLVDIPSANWSKPPGIGGDIGDFVPQFMLGVKAGTAGNLAVTIGTATAGVQDPCVQTVDATTSGADDPASTIGPSDFPLRIADPTTSVVVNTTIHGITFANVLPGTSTTKVGTFSATIDAGEVYPLFRLIPNATKDSVCTALANFGAPCETCAFNGQPYCLTIQAVEIGAVVSPTAVTPIAAANIPSSCSP